MLVTGRRAGVVETLKCLMYDGMDLTFVSFVHLHSAGVKNEKRTSCMDRCAVSTGAVFTHARKEKNART